MPSEHLLHYPCLQAKIETVQWLIIPSQMSKVPTMQKIITTLVAALPPVGAVIGLTGFIFVIFGILGLTLFRGLFSYCDDQYTTYVSGKDDCIGNSQCIGAHKRLVSPHMIQTTSVCVQLAMWVFICTIQVFSNSIALDGRTMGLVWTAQQAFHWLLCLRDTAAFP